MLGFTAPLAVPAGSELIGADDDDSPPVNLPSPQRFAVDVDVVSSAGDVLFGDSRDAAFDLAVPLVPGTACPTGGPTVGRSCTWIDDTDDRDCAVTNVCIAGGSLDIESAIVTICGRQVTVDLIADPARGAICSGPVDLGGRPAAGATGSSTVVALDDAGNPSMPFGGTGCFLSPPRILTTLNNGLPLRAAVARDGGGRPLVLTVDAQGTAGDTALTVMNWTGASWQMNVIDTTPDANLWTYRGRIDQQALPDGSVLFCATRRHAAPTGFGDALDDIDMSLPGAIDILHLTPDGTVTVVTRPNARPLGCAIAYQELLGEPRIVVAYATAAGRTINASPRFVSCSQSDGSFDCDSGTASGTLFATLPIYGFDLDAAFDGAGRLHIVGRGFQPAGLGPFAEHSLFRVRIAADFGSREFQALLPEERGPAPSDGICPTFVSLYRSPRLVNQNGRMVLYYEHWENRPSPSLDDRTIRLEARRLPEAGSALGPAVDIGLITGGGPPSIDGVEPPGFSRAWPSTFTGGRTACSTAAAIPSAFDVVTAGTTARAFFATRDDSRGLGRLGNFRASTALHDVSVRLEPVDSGLDLPTIADARVVEAEVGRFAEDSSNAVLLAPSFVSAFVDEDGEASVVVNRSLPVGFDYLYQEERAHQWVEPRSTAAVRGTCDARESIVLSADVMNLSLDTPFDRPPWSSPRFPDAMSAANPNLASNLSCAIDTAMEGLGLRMPGVNDVPFYLDVRQVFGSSLVSLGSMIETSDRPAVLYGRRLAGDPDTFIVPPSLRQLRVRLNGAEVSASLPPATRNLSALVRQLNAALGGTVSRPVVAVYPVMDVTSRTRIGARVAVLAWPESPGTTPTAEVLPSSLGIWFGFNRDIATGLGRVLDASEGDRHDRLRSCNDACVRGAAGTPGTCLLPRDCIDMNPGSAPDGLEDNLLYHALTGLHLRDGRPPLRTGQSGVCVPAEQRTDPRACMPGNFTPHRGGTPLDYRAYTRSLPITSACDPGEVFTPGTGELPEILCTSCGPRNPTTGIAEGSPRACNSDADCNPSRECRDGNCAGLVAAGVSLCTHLAGPYMGVAAGAGFCAEPALCSPGSPNCVARNYDGFIEAPYLQTLFVSTVSLGATPAPLNVAAGDFGVSPNSVECVMTGCALCTGSEVNGFCVNDAECAPGHVCLQSTAADLALETPACLLRPLLHDGRVFDTLPYSAFSPDNTVRALVADPLTLAPGLLATTLGTLNTTVESTLRSLVVPARIISDVLDVRGTGAEAIILNTIDARIAGGVVEVIPIDPRVDVPGYRPGTPGLRVTLFVDGNVVASGRTQFDVTDVIRPEGNFRVTVSSARAYAATLVPFVDGSGLRFRAIDAVVLESSVARGDAADVLANAENYDIFLGGGFVDVGIGLAIVGFIQNWIVLHFLVIGLDWFIPVQLSNFPSTIDPPLDSLGTIYTSLATTPILGPMFLGLSPVMERGRTYPGMAVGTPTLEDGWVGRGISPTPVTPLGLDLRYRGADLGDDLAFQLGTQDVEVTEGVSACCLGMEPDPACAEIVPAIPCPMVCP